MNNMKYTAINIGPVVGTLSLMRKPYDLWNASYVFSHLMSKIIAAATSAGGELLSLKMPSEMGKIGVGLYPDRAYFSSEEGLGITAIINSSLSALSTDTGIEVGKLAKFFNIMGIELDRGDFSSDREIISSLNNKLDAMELHSRIEDREARKDLLEYLMNGVNSELKSFAFNKGETFAAATTDFLAKFEADDDEGELTNHNYFCIVQADGDNLGQIVRNLKDGELANFSPVLMAFGEEASAKIKEYGGFPIYAGGDDLLFMVPVVTESRGSEERKKNIFTLIDEIDKLYDKVQKDAKDRVVAGTEVNTTMSYGVAISYYNYPLYEAFGSARDLLFTKAKDKKNGKNCIVLKLLKHSGSSLEFVLSKAQKELKAQFEELLYRSCSGNLVSAMAHKLRSNSKLVKEILNITDDVVKEIRLKAFFTQFMGLGEKKNIQDYYLTNVMNLLLKLKVEDSETIYSMMRVAKFINGEDVKDSKSSKNVEEDGANE